MQLSPDLDGLVNDFPLDPGIVSGRRGQVIRVFDIVAAGLGLLILSPLLLLIALLIRRDSRGPALFLQERLGRHRAPFTLIKFRTMVLDAEAAGARWAVRDDPRITRLGRFLRRSRIDELPQLWNVFKGEMSLVGPRPIRQQFADQLASHAPIYNRRFLVKPGLTGYAQLYAPYGATVEEQLAKIPFDQRYARDGLRVRAYLGLIWKTVLQCWLGR